MTTIVFHLYVAGKTSYSQQILRYYKDACNECIKSHTYQIEVIDILKRPEFAEKYKVLAIPTICRIMPSPEKRIIGKVDSQQALVAIRFLTQDLSIL